MLLPRAREVPGSIPALVPALALLGLAVLCFYTVPAVMEHRELERRHRSLSHQARQTQAEVETRRRAIREGRRSTFASMKAAAALHAEGAHYIPRRNARLQDLASKQRAAREARKAKARAKARAREQAQASGR